MRNDYMMNDFTTCKNPTVVKISCHKSTNHNDTFCGGSHPWKSTCMESVQDTRT